MANIFGHSYRLWFALYMLQEILKPLLKELITCRELLQKCLSEISTHNEREHRCERSMSKNAGEFINRTAGYCISGGTAAAGWNGEVASADPSKIF